MWSSWTESAKSSLTQALEKTGDVISRAATDAGKASRVPKSSTEGKQAQDQQQQQEQTHLNDPEGMQQQQQLGGTETNPNSHNDLLKSLAFGWNTVVETTKASIQKAEGKVKEQQQFLQQQLTKARVAYYKRDPELPLDVVALKDAEVVYITDRLITMGHPAMASQLDIEITGERKLAAIGHLLNRRHDGRFMVWNISEVPYDVEILDDQVLTFSFPGSPSPPLGLLLKLLVSMESWLKADERNVAVVHCLTGKGRTSTVVAAFLCWMGEAGFSDIYQALEYIAACKQITSDELTIPSQRRYCSYFKNMLDGVHPSQPPLMLSRIIMSEAPKFAVGPSRKTGDTTTTPSGEPESSKSPTPSTEEEMEKLMGCVPYIQLFKAGKLLHTAPATLNNFPQSDNEIPFCQVSDGCISFHINQVIQGDILIRARHLTPNKKRISMFRAAFHTGYVPPKVMRLTKSQLDGACVDDRFSPDFFLDLIFEPADAEEAGKLLQDTDEASSPAASATNTTADTKPASNTALTGGGNLVTASAYDTMMHRDSRFWDVITARKKQHDEKNETAAPEDNDPTFGPTVGRRRAFNGQPALSGADTKTATAEAEKKGAFETFSIGGEFDFLPEVIQPESHTDTPHHDRMSSRSTVPKKDSLMEALMGALDEDVQTTPDQEVIIFECHPDSQKFMPMAPILEPPSATDDEKNTTTTDSTIASAVQEQVPTFAMIPPPATAVPKQENVVPESASVGAGSDDSVQQEVVNDIDTVKLEDDVDALLADIGATNVDDDVTDDDLLNMDIDDAELQDLENFLSKA